MRYGLWFLICVASGMTGMTYAAECVNGDSSVTTPVIQPPLLVCDEEEEEACYQDCMSDVGDLEGEDLKEVKTACKENCCGYSAGTVTPSTTTSGSSDCQTGSEEGTDGGAATSESGEENASAIDAKPPVEAETTVPAEESTSTEIVTPETSTPVETTAAPEESAPAETAETTTEESKSEASQPNETVPSVAKPAVEAVEEEAVNPAVTSSPAETKPAVEEAIKPAVTSPPAEVKPVAEEAAKPAVTPPPAEVKPVAEETKPVVTPAASVAKPVVEETSKPVVEEASKPKVVEETSKPVETSPPATTQPVVEGGTKPVESTTPSVGTPVVTTPATEVTAVPTPVIESPPFEPAMEGATPTIGEAWGSNSEYVQPEYTPAPSFFGDYADHWVKANPYHSATFNLGVNSSSQTLILYPSRNSEIVDNRDGSLTYTVNPNFRGVDTFTYTLTDAKGSVSVFVVKVQVSEDYTGYDVWDFDKTSSGMDYSGNQGNSVYIAWPEGASCDVIYAVNDQGVADSQLLYINPTERTTTAFGAIRKGYDIEGLEISPSNYRLYGVASNKADKDKRGRLYLVDPTTAELTLIGKTGFDDINALAFRYDGTLWGWAAGKGIVEINTETGYSYVRVPFKTVNAEGMAWSSDGKFLYASEGTTLWWWRYGQDSTVSKKCQNLPGEVEALETLDGGMLMFAVDQDSGHKLYAYDPWACEIVDNRSFVTHYSDIESIAWSAKCEPQPSTLPPVESWTGAFDNEGHTNLYCQKKPGLLKVTGEVSLYPSDSQAFIQTNWQTVWFGDDSSPDTEEAIEKLACSKAPAPYDVDCMEPHYNSEIVSDTFKFEITGWWPGVPSDTDPNTMIGTYFSVDVMDMKGNSVPGHQNISRNFVWIDSLCDPDTKAEAGKTNKPKTSEKTKVSDDSEPTEEGKTDNSGKEEESNTDESSPTADRETTSEKEPAATSEETKPVVKESSTDKEKSAKDQNSKPAKDKPSKKDKQSKPAKEKDNDASNKNDESAKDTEEKASDSKRDDVADKEEKQGTSEADKQDQSAKDKGEDTTTDKQDQSAKDSESAKDGKSAKDSEEESATADKQDKSAKDNGDETASDKQDKSAKDNGDETASDKQDKSAKDNGDETASDKQDKSAKDNADETASDKQDKSAKDNGDETVSDKQDKSAKDNGDETASDKQDKKDSGTDATTDKQDKSDKDKRD